MTHFPLHCRVPLGARVVSGLVWRRDRVMTMQHTFWVHSVLTSHHHESTLANTHICSKNTELASAKCKCKHTFLVGLERGRRESTLRHTAMDAQSHPMANGRAGDASSSALGRLSRVLFKLWPPLGDAGGGEWWRKECIPLRLHHCLPSERQSDRQRGRQ